MNADGIIQKPSSAGSGGGHQSGTDDENTLPRPARNSLSPRSGVGPPESSHEGSPSPPPSLESTVSSTAGLTPQPPQHQQKRPKFLDFLPAGARPLSPIQSSPETSPNDSPASTHRSLRFVFLCRKYISFFVFMAASLASMGSLFEFKNFWRKN